MVEIDDSLIGKDVLEMAFERCIKCSTCKYSYKEFEKSCPSGEKFLFESYLYSPARAICLQAGFAWIVVLDGIAVTADTDNS